MADIGEHILEGFETTQTIPEGAEQPFVSSAISSFANLFQQANNAYQSFLDYANPVAGMSRRIANGEFDNVGDDASQLIAKTSPANYAIIVPENNQFKYSSYSNIKNIDESDALNSQFGIKNGLIDTFSKSLFNKQDEVNKTKPLGSFVLYLSLPVKQQCIFSRNFNYTKEPVPEGTTLTTFFWKDNRMFKFRGVESTIQKITQTPFTTNVYKSSPLAKAVDKISNSLLNTYGVKLKQKVMKKFTKDILPEGATEKIQTAISLAKEYDVLGIAGSLVSGNANAIWKGNLQQQVQKDPATNTFSVPQYTQAMIDILASAGYLFKIYYRGIQYNNVVITHFQCTDEPRKANSMILDLDLLQLPIIKKTSTTHQNSIVKSSMSKHKNIGKVLSQPSQCYYNDTLQGGRLV